MSKSTHTIVYRYEVGGHTVEIERVHVRTAYARNGNVHNPTEYSVWQGHRDGEYLGTFDHRADAYEVATGHGYCSPEGRKVGSGEVRPFTLVQDEMKANYRGRKVVPAGVWRRVQALDGTKSLTKLPAPEEQLQSFALNHRSDQPTGRI